MQSLSNLVNKVRCNIESFMEPELDFSSTPWRLSVQVEDHPLKVFMYYASHKEAKDQEDICRMKGWTIHGIEWCVS